MKNIAVIVASGSGIRTGLEKPKQFNEFLGTPLFEHSFKFFQHTLAFTHIILVANPEWHHFIKERLYGYCNYSIVSGGDTRAKSVYAGLLAAKELSPQNVFIHDAARPYIDGKVIDEMIVALNDGVDGAIPFIEIADALWQIDNNNELIEPIEKTARIRAQTPQAFNYNKLLAAYSSCDFATALDDAQIATQSGMVVKAIKGNLYSDKITYKEDFPRMERTLTPRFLPRAGTGFDVHRFCEGEFVTLCGIQIPHTMGLEGHSDADVAWHALTDALLGALALGDIGKAFPPSDAKWKGAASSIFLGFARDEVKRLNAEIANIDITIICEAPKVGKYRETLQKSTADILGIPIDRVGIKATTTEKLGFTGRKEGIAAQAIASLIQYI
jgi:2-C-methyl-D-erythritol 4-phosphate cytidylyltransferase/2-C-methyl-D-erythritol 2,4-cyclodiphosphate synthase